ncbi:MAG: TMEM14 family protein [Fimbriimonadaceae bacterium]|jgi:uncharacterized membrane protein (UPF0136 family)|nr:TMEM14 family protein [Fimbriimonadaceae bacterium]
MTPALLRKVLYAYSVFMVGFGLFGTLRANEPQSLIGGSAVALAIAGLTLLSQKNQKVGFGLAAIILVLTSAHFTRNWVTKGFYPAGIIVIASAIPLSALVVGHFQASKKPD